MPKPASESTENEPESTPVPMAQETETTGDETTGDEITGDAVTNDEITGDAVEGMATGDSNDEVSEGASPAASLGSRVIAAFRNRRILIMMGAGLALLVIIGVRSLFPSARIQQTPLELSDAVRLEQEFQRILNGRTTRLYVTGYPITDAMLEDLPIAPLQEAKQKAIKARDSIDQAPPNQSFGESADDTAKVYNDEGKRINFDAPDWQDYARIDAVLIDDGKITDRGLAKIAQLPDLEHVRLRLSPITDEGIKSLADCDELWLVNLPHSELTNEGLRLLGSVPNLKQLRLGSDRLTNDCCRVIAGLTNLRGLHLIGIPVTDDGVKVLSELPHLESLYLDDSAVTDSGWDWVFRNHPQLHVHVNQSHHDRDPQSHTH